ncbi:MAG: RluA family pseudouridine synthase [Clostridia bacterium]|nr:RluA family pseudouridine synthase [Clostridia bacterium]
MERKHLTVAPEEETLRLDVLLSRRVEGLTRSAAQRLLEEGKVSLQGRPLKKNHRLRAGEELELCLPDPVPTDARPQDIPLDIVYEDADVAVVNKPRGMVVHPAPGNPDGTLVNALLAHCGQSLSGVGGAIRPGIVHRIDKDTSGLLIIAKNDRAHLALSAQLKDHTLSRVYEAVAIGSLKEDRGTVDAPIGRSLRDRKRMAVVPDGRRAVTHYQVLARYPGYTHLRCQLETGRTHQIRVHMAYLGHPLAGDPVYGPKNDPERLGGQCLHARELTFVHPTTGQTVHLTCPLPDWFSGFLDRLERRL